ncbi:hypothetical protein BACPLE_02838 [Phocaeicola plebeius DSM 17135]|uniref:Uncharacterized protein n=1 Tax=Phocaeicola plebeius (strain DSM 17135 / JCM 12973 / CCUG 54634 / M2) TaxID=484018 RepID=B5D1J5_PHOPM|nr:hypothetical protein BACPLE_02838 [Phocaeicola plebeius DSM 17135]
MFFLFNLNHKFTNNPFLRIVHLQKYVYPQNTAPYFELFSIFAY